MSVVQDSALFTAFCDFAKHHLYSGDIDPAYPVLFRRFEDEDVSGEDRVWRLLLYVTFYSLGSAERAWRLFPHPQMITAPLRLPTGSERRAFRGNDLGRAHLNAALSIARMREGSLAGWVAAAAAPGGKKGWQQVRGAFQQVPYGGPWSSYKWADLMKHVMKVDITANDIGVGGGSETAGPIPGMVRLTGRHWSECATDVGLQQALLDEALAQGVPLKGLDQMETCLCDFNSLCKGRYYVGRDIDEQLHGLLTSSNWEQWRQARLASFPHTYLGELHGWVGVDRLRCQVFKDTGVVLARQ